MDLPYYNKRVLIAPLCWGLGHATRCVPIIDQLQRQDCEVAIASDGLALQFLRGEFPSLQSFAIAPYGVQYRYNSMLFNMALQAGKLWKAIRREREQARELSKQWNADIIISDNRLGFRSADVKSIYISHQLQVLGGSQIGTAIATMLHKMYYERFDELWVPDYMGANNLAGKLSQGTAGMAVVKYLGPLSRFRAVDVQKTLDILVVLSGPEPQRSYLERILADALTPMTERYKINVVRGTTTQGNVAYPQGMQVHNLLQSSQLHKLVSRSKVVVCRSGYSSIMDLASLGSTAILVPTPGQYEQEYLGEYLDGRHQFHQILQSSLPENLAPKIETLLKH